MSARVSVIDWLEVAAESLGRDERLDLAVARLVEQQRITLARALELRDARVLAERIRAALRGDRRPPSAPPDPRCARGEP